MFTHGVPFSYLKNWGEIPTESKKNLLHLEESTVDL